MIKKARPALLRLLLAADEPGAVRLVRRLLDSGVDHERVLLGLVAPVMAYVGHLWQHNRLSVAHEHAASSVAERVVAAVRVHAGARPHRRDRLVIACPEGEWHTLPPRLLAETLRLQGWPVTFLGAGLPAAHLTVYLQQYHPVAVLLSASLTVRLPQARRSVLAARRAGVPVLAGGAGFGHDARLALRLGAHAWASGPSDAAALLHDWPPKEPAHATLEHLADEEHARLCRAIPGLTDSAMQILREEFPPLHDYDRRQLEATRDDLQHILNFLAAAVYLDECTVFTEFIGWLASVLAARDVPPGSVQPVLAHFQNTLDGRPRTQRILAAGQHALGIALQGSPAPPLL
ncbi:cobalamin B12-binding domain-containing protein [Couchioplanes azureus]|uniref:cobalamin B12-binding domain-containing protein n=1 Tax=Couchioplanes caeruleus TaxID=56438 RepID=UPI001670CABD|nr:B12-binding domain-containing protein [Couchioplanes caeruleus]